MSTQPEKLPPRGALPAELRQKFGAELDGWFGPQFRANMQQYEENKPKSMAIIATKGTMDWAYSRLSCLRPRLPLVGPRRFSLRFTVSHHSKRNLI